MEEKFYLDDFELSLQEQANQFKMAPTKKVWHGIYNDLHPGRRWPSVVVSLLLLFSVVFIGHINNTDKNAARADLQTSPNAKDISKPGATNEKRQLSSIPAHHENVDQKNNGNNDGEQRNVNKEVADFSGLNENVTRVDKTIPAKENNQTSPVYSTQISGEVKTGYSFPVAGIKGQDSYSWNQKENVAKSQVIGEDKIIENLAGIVNRPDISMLRKGVGSTLPQEFYENSPVIPGVTNINSTTKKLVSAPVNDQTSPANSLGQSDENAALAITKKKNDKISWTYYAAPILSSVSFSGVSLKENTNSNLSSSPISQVTQKDMKVIRNAAFGFEAGIQMNYSFATKLQFTTGAHLTRSGYNIVSNLVHPTLATLSLRNSSTGDTYSRNFVTHYGDGTGKSTVTLRNYSYQASIPVGLQYIMWNNDNIQLNLAANFEPSLIFESDAYLLASDGKNYVNVPDLMRRWNFSSNFSPFVSFRSNKFKWNIGPNIRYQWLSTYQKAYPVKEHLIDYGIRVGISK